LKQKSSGYEEYNFLIVSLQKNSFLIFKRSIGVGPITTSPNAYIQTCFIYLVQEAIKKAIENKELNIKYVLKIFFTLTFKAGILDQ
jgi:hypothetical protein